MHIQKNGNLVTSLAQRKRGVVALHA